MTNHYLLRERQESPPPTRGIPDHVNRLDVAARRAVVTGANRMNMQMTTAIMDELGAEYVETSAHMGARPSHAEWQGRVFHVGGAKDGYPDFVSSTGYGGVAGLGGANCRHSYFPYFPGISTRSYTDEQLKNIDPPPFEYLGEKYTYYEATQSQRYLETEMRKTKRKIIGHDASGDKQAFQNMSIKLNQQKRAYREFSNAAGLRYQFERAGVEGYGRSVAQRAAWQTRLIKSELAAVNKYIGGGYAYKINEKLRLSKALEDIDKEFVKNMDSALKKLPLYSGDLNRSLYFANEKVKEEFLKDYIKGNTIIRKEYMSTTRGNIYNPEGMYRYIFRILDRGEICNNSIPVKKKFCLQETADLRY